MIYKVFAILPGESVLAGCAEEGIVALLTYRIEDGQYFLHCFEEKTEETVYSLNQAMGEIGEANTIITMALYENTLLLVTWEAKYGNELCLIGYPNAEIGNSG